MAIRARAPCCSAQHPLAPTLYSQRRVLSSPSQSSSGFAAFLCLYAHLFIGQSDSGTCGASALWTEGCTALSHPPCARSTLSYYYWPASTPFPLETTNEATVRVPLVFGSSSLGLSAILATLRLIYPPLVVPAVISIIRVYVIPVIAVAGLPRFILDNLIVGSTKYVLLASIRGANFVTSSTSYHHIQPKFLKNRAAHPVVSSRHQTTESTHRLGHLRMKILVLSFTLIERALHSSIAVLQYITSTNTPWDRWEICYVSRHSEYMDCAALS